MEEKKLMNESELKKEGKGKEHMMHDARDRNKPPPHGGGGGRGK